MCTSVNVYACLSVRVSVHTQACVSEYPSVCVAVVGRPLPGMGTHLSAHAVDLVQ